MKNNIKLLFFLTFFLVLSTHCFSQTTDDIKKILSKTNVGILNELAAKYAKENKEKREIALLLAKEKGWIIRRDTNGTVMELQFLDKYGFPVYYITNNANAAATTSTKKLFYGGGLGLSLDGTNMKTGLWDEGNVRSTHQEFNNTGTPRVVNKNSATEASHSTHVAGTIAAGGVQTAAKGMAYNSSIDAYDWTNDLSEMTTAAASGLLISNHSYGIISGWYNDGSTWFWYGTPSISAVEDYSFGFYDTYSANFDDLAYNAPYYLMVKSAGNDAFYGPTSQPTAHKVWNGSAWVSSSAVRDLNGGTDGYDCITSWGNAKNVLTVGAVDDIPGGYTQPSDVVIGSFSSRGPTDDGRIKPDIVGNGINVYSSDINNTSNVYYSNKSGTSMASPNVTGSLLLLQEHYNNLYSSYMKSATLKALVIHTADESGSAEGPDFIYGWGLLNTATAANVITGKDKSSLILEESLANGATYNLDVTAKGNCPLTVTITWTDPEGTPVAAQLNPTTKMLVNDLDLLVKKSSTKYYPYVLDGHNPSDPATKSVNSVDNVEKVYIATPTAGTYTIVVTHKGTLTDGAQDFSVVVTGISLGFPEVTTNTSVTNITKKTADMAGEVLTDNGNTVTERGFVYNTSGNPSTSDSKVIVGSGTGTFSTTLTGLLPSTIYHAKAYATNSTGTVYGAEVDFTTVCEVVTVFPTPVDFNSLTSCPTCWQTLDNQSNGQLWRIGTFVPLGANPSFSTTGNYAYFNYELYGSGVTQNSDLISPTYDFSGYKSITLSFKEYFRGYSGSSATLYYSINNGAWTQIVKYTNTTSNPLAYSKTWTTVLINQQVRFKWNYSYTGSSSGYYWCVDDINVTAIPNTSLVVTNTTQTISSNMAYLNVNVKGDGKLTVATDKILTVTGNFTIESDASGTGSFIQDGTLNIAGSTTTQKYLPNTTTTGWTLSVPVQSATNTVFTGADNIWLFDPYTANWQSFAGGSLNQMTGYVVRFPTTTTVSFSGALNNGNMLRNNDLKRYITPQNNYGWNYVGNPYPSPIDWSSSGITRTNVDAAVYYRKANGDPASWSAGVGTNGGTNIIPSMQAFWVKVTLGQSTGSLQFTNAARIHGSNNTYKSTPTDILSLTISNDTTTDETAIRFIDGATPLFDSDFDAVKMFAYNSSVPQIYSLSNNDEYAINALPMFTSNVSVPVGFKTHTAGNYNITAAYMNSFINNISIVLEDLYDNVLTDLNQQNTYTFNASAGSSTDRFVVHFNPITTANKQNVATDNDINIYSYGNAVYIANVNDNNATVVIFNVLGQEMLSQKLINRSLNKVKADLATGQYIVKVISNAKTISQKIYLSNVF